jgi:hypothetical protein
MKTKLHFITITLALGLILIACKNGSPDDTNNETDSLTNQESIPSTEIDTNVVEEQPDTIKKVYKNPEVQEAHLEIVKKYGKQWDFCKCIVKSDSVNTALMEAPDDKFDAVMERSNFIDNKCKGLLIQPNATPEDRYKHEKKVKKCLDSVKGKG